MGLAGVSALGLDIANLDKQLFVILETDGCFVDGVKAVTDCSVEHRTLRIEDYGKIAGVFVHIKTEKAVRFSLNSDIREKAANYAPDAESTYSGQLLGYQRIPDDELFIYKQVVLKTPIQQIISVPGVRVNCSVCGEEIFNGRQLLENGKNLCRFCAGDGYYLG
jgi:formylmethanofuran dehydrogenase subunit E